MPWFSVITPAAKLAKNGKSGINMTKLIHQTLSYCPQLRHKVR
ncbi:MAG TPA: hypothetical protein VJX30_20680 [Terriglobales bacterium]|nr:hypothetical protein [Terriglobales bacterium]